jgi:hypothetical protein
MLWPHMFLFIWFTFYIHVSQTHNWFLTANVQPYVPFICTFQIAKTIWVLAHSDDKIIKVFILNGSSASKTDMLDSEKQNTSLSGFVKFSWKPALYFILWLFIWWLYVSLLSSIFLNKVGGLGRWLGSKMFNHFPSEPSNSCESFQ